MSLTVGLSIYFNSNFDHFKESFESIYHKQTKKPDKIIIVYDGEVSENIVSLIDEYCKLNIPIEVIRNKENKGLTRSLNLMIEKCQTDYFARMDTDDISMPERFERQLKFLEKHTSIDVLGTCAYDIDNKGHVIRTRRVPSYHENIKMTLPKLNPIIHPSVVFRTDSLKKIGGYNPKYKTSQDYALWFDTISKGLNHHNLKERLLKYRLDSNYSKRKNFKYRWNDVIIKWEGIPKITSNYCTRIYSLTPLLIYCIPNFLFNFFKTLDLRNK